MSQAQERAVNTLDEIERVEAPSTTKIIFIKREATKNRTVYLFVKRFFDVVLSVIALVLLSPLFLVLSVMVKLEDGGPVIYKHQRVGKNGKTFYLYKFRSMIPNPPPLEEILSEEQLIQYKKDYKIDNDPRITKIGNFLRRSSLDELPQLLNIIKGELSIVGPRPVLQEETEKYGPNRDKFLSVVPGLTGYWQTNGRSETTYEERMQMELYYVDHRNLWLDIKIIFKTFATVLSQKGAQ